MKLIKRVLRPLRVAMGKLVILPERTYHVPSVEAPLDWNVRMTLIEKAARFIANDKIAGDYLEFGVFRGESFVQAYHAIRNTFENRIAMTYNASAVDRQERQRLLDEIRFFAFDSFEGLPPLEGVDQLGDDFSAGQYACGLDEFRNNLATRGVNLDKVICVPGWFNESCVSETIERYGMRQASVIWIDCDLYHSAKSVLEFVTPLLQDGTVIIFDDWFAFRGNPLLGEQKAFHEWKQTVEGFEFNEFHKEGTYRNSFIASKRDSSGDIPHA